jgi:hypothetical protein
VFSIFKLICLPLTLVSTLVVEVVIVKGPVISGGVVEGVELAFAG